MANDGIDDGRAIGGRLENSHGCGFLRDAGANGGDDSDGGDEGDSDEGEKEAVIARRIGESEQEETEDDQNGIGGAQNDRHRPQIPKPRNQ